MVAIAVIIPEAIKQGIIGAKILENFDNVWEI
jgi:hypothetical protein